LKLKPLKKTVFLGFSITIYSQAPQSSVPSELPWDTDLMVELDEVGDVEVSVFVMGDPQSR
jgi:hypothetical protein